MELPVFPSIDKNHSEKRFEISSTLVSEFNVAKRILIFLERLTKILNSKVYCRNCEKSFCGSFTEANSNLYHDKVFFNHIDRYVFNFTEEDFRTYAQIY